MPTLRTALGGLLVLGTALAPLAPAAASPAATGPTMRNGLTQPVHSYQQAIRELVSVQTEADSDRDGQPDRVTAFVTRPKATADGLKVASIIEASPYYSKLNNIPNHPVDMAGRARPGNSRAQQGFSPAGERATSDYSWSYYDNYFVPRGYAVLAVDSLGTGGSTGCPTSGAPNEGLGVKAVVDWLNGRARAYATDGREVKADWSTGNAGMAGVSYNGTLPNQVATTGVPGLRTIVSIAAISSWYDYYRANGGVLAPGGYQGEDADVLARAVLTRDNPQRCAGLMDAIERDQDRVSGDYTEFWRQRDYTRDVHKVRASVFVVHGLHDWNVKTKQFAQWYTALAKRGVPHKLWLHQAQHNDPRQVRLRPWFTAVHRWFDHWLYGIDNGIEREPRADVEQAPGVWRSDRDWPAPGVRPTLLRFGRDNGPAGQGRHFTDAPARTAEQLAAEPDKADPNRLVYLTQPLPKAVRLSGTPLVRVRAGVDGKSPYLTALLVDYGSAERFAALRKTDRQECVGESIPGNSGCFNLYEYTQKTTPFEVVTRGWLDVRNRHSPSRTEPVEPGRAYGFDWDLQPTDHVFRAGHRIGVVLISTDRDFTLRYPAGTRVEVDPGASWVRLPLVGAEQ